MAKFALSIAAIAAVSSISDAQQNCNIACTRILKPVCGSDGITYSNECVLRSFNCRTGTTVSIAHQGSCTATAPKPLIAPAVVPPSPSIADPICPTFCTRELRQVCGSNRVTYTNLCELQRASCNSAAPISKAADGACGAPLPLVRPMIRPQILPDLPPAPAPAPFPAPAPVPAPQQPCPSACTRILRQVCGSNGITYTNECEMQRASCASTKPITKAADGACASGPAPAVAPRVITPILYSQAPQPAPTPAEAPAVAPTPDCNIFCTLELRPVCASNGVTFSNECEMRSAACRQGLSLTKVSDGACLVAEADLNTPAPSPAAPIIAAALPTAVADSINTPTAQKPIYTKCFVGADCAERLGGAASNWSCVAHSTCPPITCVLNSAWRRTACARSKCGTPLSIGLGYCVPSSRG